MKYVVTVEGLKLPRLNEVLRWPWFKQRAEIKRVRQAVEGAAKFTFGLGAAEPLSKAQVCITAYGDYSKYDGDGVHFKDALDSIVARPIRAYGQTVGRRWGLVIDDSRAVIGKPEYKDEPADDYKLEIAVYEV